MGRRLRGSAPWPDDIDLAFNAAEPRDAHGRWVTSPASALDKAVHGDVADLERMVRADRGPTRIHMPQLSGVPIPGSKADAIPHAPGQEVDLTAQFEKELRALGVSVQDTTVPVADLKPTQDQLVMSKVAGLAHFMLTAPLDSSVFEPIFVSADNHVIDGHHRWAARTVRDGVNGTHESMAVRKIGLNIADALPLATQFMDEWGLPRAGMTGQSTTVSNFALSFDLAAPARSTVVVATRRTKVDEDGVVRQIATLLRTGYRFERLHGDFSQEVEGITRLLEPWGIGAQAVQMALGLTHTEGGGRRGTAHSPNARLAESGATLDDQIRDVRDNDVYFRAAYLANAALRMQTTLQSGGTRRAALQKERTYYLMHEQARRGRLQAVAQVSTAADTYGPVLGWYLNPLKNNEAECIAANGHNFYAEQGTVIGLPGSVHNQCGCYAGPPWEDAAMVNDVFANVRSLRPTGSTAKFKLRSRTA